MTKLNGICKLVFEALGDSWMAVNGGLIFKLPCDNPGLHDARMRGRAFVWKEALKLKPKLTACSLYHVVAGGGSSWLVTISARSCAGNGWGRAEHPESAAPSKLTLQQ